MFPEQKDFESELFQFFYFIAWVVNFLNPGFWLILFILWRQDDGEKFIDVRQKKFIFWVGAFVSFLIIISGFVWIISELFF
jgi:hypothetical protein